MAVLRALNSCATKYNEVQPLYNQNISNQSERQAHVRHPDGSRGCGVVSSEASLVKYTDNSSILVQQGFQRLRDRFKLLNKVRKILKGERTQHCFFNRVDRNDGVGVMFNKSRNKANYSNIMRCANAWGCPVCAAIISEHRKNEVKEAMDWWQGQGGSVLLLTLTVPHYSHTDIKQLKKDLKKAYSKFFKGVRASQNMFSKWMIEHYISCFEITHGDNGFHPHYHVLLFIPYSIGVGSLSLMQADMFKVWEHCCLKAGLGAPSQKHGLHLQAGNEAGNYVSKWGLEHEMTKGHVKKGKKDGRTPFDILRNFDETGDEKEANLFRLYYFAFKGQRQLNWSRGLKKLCSKGGQEKTDQEIVDDTDNVAELLFKLDIELWNAVRSQGKQGELLIAVVEDQTLKKPMELIRQCLVDQGSIRQHDHMTT